MKMVFTKRSDKNDELVIIRDNGTSETILCPKQGILPHDMIHYAVESVMTKRGFLSLTKEGHTPAFTLTDTDNENAIERLVEIFQAELWSIQSSDTDFIATYHHACAARGHALIAITPDNIAAIRNTLNDLSVQWANVAENTSLTLTFTQ